MRTIKMFVFLFVIIPVAVVFVTDERRSQAAPQDTDRWWVGSSESGFNYDHVCKDGIVIWGMTTLDEQEGYVGVYLYNGYVEGAPDNEPLVEEYVQMVEYYGRWTIKWPHDLEPGTKIVVGVGLPGISGSFGFVTPIRDCYVPVDPQEEMSGISFDCNWGSFSEEECSDVFYQNYRYMTVSIPIAENECRDFQFLYNAGHVITHIDLSMAMISAQTYNYSIYLLSPQADSWVTLVDKQTLASDNLGDIGSNWLNRGWDTGPFLLDDDSSFDLANGTPPFTETSFAPNPGSFSAFIGGIHDGTWYLRICTHSLTTSSRGFLEQGIEQGNIESDESGSIFKGVRFRISHDKSAPSIFEIQGYPKVVGNQAVFQWKTDDKTTSIIRYGTSSGFHPFEKHDDNPVTDHNMSLENLNPGTTYYYVIEAKNLAGIISTSEERQFATERAEFTLTINVNGQGTVQRNPDKPAYQSGEAVTLTAIPASGYRFTGWSGSLSGTQNPVQIVMNNNKSISASFQTISTGNRLFIPVSLSSGNILVPTATATSIPQPTATATSIPQPTATATPNSQSITNGDFEAGSTGWLEYSEQGWDIIGTDLPTGAHSGVWAAWLGGDNDEISSISQLVTVPANAPYLAYWHQIASQDFCGYDEFYVLVNGSEKMTIDLCESTETNGWRQVTIDLSGYAGQQINLEFRVTTDGSYNSNLFLDDVSFQNNPETLSYEPFNMDSSATMGGGARITK